MGGLFVLAPLLVAFGLYEQGYRRAADRAAREHLARTRQRFERFVVSLDPVARLQRRFDAFRRALWRRGGDPAVLERLQRHAAARWGMPFDAYLFDARGTLATPRRLSLKSRRMGQCLWDELLSRGSTSPLWRTGERDFIGSTFRLKSFRQARARVVPLRTSAGDGACLWDVDPWSAEGGLVLAAWKAPSAVDLAAAACRGPRPPGWSLLAVDRQGNPHDLTGTAGKAAEAAPGTPEAPEIVPGLVRQAGEDGAVWQGRRWISVTAFGSTWYGGFPLEETDTQAGRWLVWAGLAVLALLGARFTWRWIVLGDDRFVSLRLKLVGLFLFALLVPAVGGFHLAVESWRDREAIEVSEAIAENRKALGQIDDAFLGERDRMQRMMRALLAGDLMVRDPRAFRRRVLDLVRNGEIADLYVRDTSGRLLPHLSSETDKDHRLGKLFPVFAQVCMERAGLLAATPKVGVEEAFVRQIVEEPSSGFGKLLDMPEEVIALKVVDTSEFIYWTLLPERLRPAAYCLASRKAEMAMESYLAGTLVRPRTFGPGAIRAFAARDGDREFYPAPGYRHRPLRQLVRRTVLLGADRQERLTINGRRWLATTRLGRQLEGVTLLALYPEDLITGRIAALRAAAAWVGLVALLIALLTGLVLADAFLLPIGALGAGIAALRRRDTRFRLEVSQKDELGELAVAFNALLENFGEVDEAKIIQGVLFPPTPVRIGPYAVHGVSRPATDLGGDYFDVAELGPGRCFALVADVSGHGIAAALVMAMARALVARHGREAVDPAAVLAELNHVIHVTVKRKRRLMTCAAIWIDTTTHEGLYFGFGHPYPFLRRAGEERLATLEATGFPLGATARFQADPVRFSLAPGDRLILFTDGLTESLARDGSDGFEELRRHVASRPALPLEQACEDLLDTHPAMFTGRPQPDDFTVLLIERAR